MPIYAPEGDATADEITKCAAGFVEFGREARKARLTITNYARQHKGLNRPDVRRALALAGEMERMSVEAERMIRGGRVAVCQCCGDWADTGPKQAAST